MSRSKLLKIITPISAVGIITFIVIVVLIFQPPANTCLNTIAPNFEEEKNVQLEHGNI